MSRMCDRGPGESRSARPGPQADNHSGAQARDAAHQPLADEHFDAGSLGRLRAIVAAAAAEAGLAPDRVQDAVIAAHELAANAVRHGAGHGRLRQWTDGQQMHCHVSDPGPADGTIAWPDPRWPWVAEHGHGLWLASQAADHLVIEGQPGQGTDVTITFVIHPQR
jgi:anti-sigma regulatory factor (Ser/Thr protein kinase)